MRYSNVHSFLNKNTQSDVRQLVESGLRHATNWPANVVELASLLLMSIDMFRQQMGYLIL